MRGSFVRVRAVVASLFVAACGHAPPAAAPAAPASRAPIENHAPTAPTPVAPPASSLRVTKIEPANGDADGGTYVKITGCDFIADGPRNAKVYFGARQGAVERFASDTEMVVEAPGGKVGDTVDVLVIFEPGGERRLPRAFTFVQKVSPDGVAP